MENLKIHSIIKPFLLCVIMLSLHLVIAGTSEVIAKEYFVAASNGNDGNNGTKETPFHTLEKGVSILSPGDILYVRGGTYQRNHSRWSPPNGISWTEAITIKAYQNEKVIVKPLPASGKTQYAVFYFLNNSQYIIMDGLTVDANGGDFGYRLGDVNTAHHIRISNGEIKNSTFNGIQGGSAEYVEVINMNIHGGPSYPIYLNGSHWLIKGCEIHDKEGFGIHIYSGGFTPSHNLIINNKIYGNGKAGVIVTKGDGNKIINNLIWGNERGIQVYSNATNTIIYNNTIYLNLKNQVLLTSSSSKSFVRNNILVGGDPTFSVLEAENGSGASIIENNLILREDADQRNLLQISDPDLLKILDPASTKNGNRIGASFEHGFINPTLPDFHLTEKSSAIGAGLVLPEVTTDIDGVKRNSTSGIDIGAYQYTGALDPPGFLRILKNQ